MRTCSAAEAALAATFYAAAVTTAAVSVDSVTPPILGPRSRAILLANVFVEVGIVITGGLVRLTGSGLGCPTWPECSDGNLIPVAAQSEGLHSFIEFGNRTLTLAVLVVAIASLIVVLRPALARRYGARWGTPGNVRRPLVWLAAGVVLGIFAQAALGGITVLLELHPATVALHFMVSMAMIALAFVLYRRALEPGDQPLVVTVRRELRVLATLVVAVAAVVLVLGTTVTGTGPHAGDADEIVRFGLDPRAISWLHSDVVLIFVGLAAAFTLGIHLTTAQRAPLRAGYLLLAACVVQGIIGYAQFFSGLPVALVALHIVGACLVWLATLNLLLSTRSRGSATLNGTH